MPSHPSTLRPRPTGPALSTRVVSRIANRVVPRTVRANTARGIARLARIELVDIVIVVVVVVVVVVVCGSSRARPLHGGKPSRARTRAT
jgi:hypothetical protein